MKLSSALLSLTSLLTCVSTLAIDGKIVCTKAQNVHDQWSGILPGRPPLIPLCSRVVRQEPFSVNVFFLNPAVKDGKVNVTGKLKLQNPEGKITYEASLRPQTFPCETATSVFLFPDCVMVSFDPCDGIGEYTISADISDGNNGSAITARATVHLEEKASRPPDKTPLAAIAQYYRNPLSENIIPAFNDFLKALPGIKKKQGQYFNPLPTLSIFFHLLQANPQLHAEFAKLVDSLRNKEDQLLGVIILHELGEKPFALLTKEAQSRWNPQLSGVFRVSKANSPWQLDVLWSEFFATGKKAPLEKIIAEIHLTQGNISPENYKKQSNKTAEDKESLGRYLIGHAASWSVGSNATQHELVSFYLEAMLNRKEIQDEYTSSIITGILDHVKQNTNKKQ